ncbi:hypothetical protein M9H77_31752 [Catharanthus roseus]|uniref:Uncharacterized protein n=1 Tax=Catharanthus roseus TaxID=4058 RepID=A0ACC0A0X6_CATRO|nr:hypothetical protein M9H77_31752 [Catharanthus roseus]
MKVEDYSFDLLLGGTDTSTTTIEWAAYELLKRPYLIEKATKELYKVIEAIIKETMRLHPIAALLAPHYAIKDCNVAGYDISKGITILINIDVKGQNFALIPFGYGRRRCPGYQLGLKFIRSILANLLHGFNWKLPPRMKPEDICMKELYGLTTHPKVPLSMIVEPRLPLHLYN